MQIFTLRYIGRHCPVTMLFGGNDHWAPESVKQELQDLIGRGTFGDANIVVKLETRLKHDFVTDPITSVPLVVEFVVGQVRQMIGRKLSFENDQHAKAATNILLSKL